jgi:hypothetical protein
MKTTKTYFAWTRSSETEQWVMSYVSACSKTQAKAEFEKQGRMIEKGTLKLAKQQ